MDVVFARLRQGSVALPVFDLYFDWAILLGWYWAGHLNWAAAALTIQIGGGLVTGLVLAGFLSRGKRGTGMAGGAWIRVGFRGRESKLPCVRAWRVRVDHARRAG
eukprot:COSAG01_NODE_36556_length_516_cov_0.654676_1_plen_104_part_10